MLNEMRNLINKLNESSSRPKFKWVNFEDGWAMTLNGKLLGEIMYPGRSGVPVFWEDTHLGERFWLLHNVPKDDDEWDEPEVNDVTYFSTIGKAKVVVKIFIKDNLQSILDVLDEYSDIDSMPY